MKIMKRVLLGLILVNALEIAGIFYLTHHPAVRRTMIPVLSRRGRVVVNGRVVILAPQKK